MINDSSYILIGRISGPHALNGRLKVAVVTDKEERFESGSRVFVLNNGRYTPYTVGSFEWHKGRIALLTLDGVDSREDSEALTGAEIFITQEDAEKSRSILNEGEFYYYDLIGAEAFIDGNVFGRIDAIVEGGSGCILSIINSEGREFLVPFVEEMVMTDKLASDKRVDIEPIDGLLDI